jgi:hypothetical protein
VRRRFSLQISSFSTATEAYVRLSLVLVVTGIGVPYHCHRGAVLRLPDIKKPTGGAVGKDHFKASGERKTEVNYMPGDFVAPEFLQFLTVVRKTCYFDLQQAKSLF